MSIDQNMVREIYAGAQQKFFVNNLALSLANREPGDALNVQGGKKYHKPIIGFSKMVPYTPITGTATQQLVTTEDEALTVTRTSDAEVISIDIDDTELSQLVDQNLVSRYSEDLGHAMRDSVEKRWVGKIEGYQDIGTAAAPVSFAGADIFDIVEDGLALVDVADVEAQRVLLVGPREYRAIERAAAQRESNLGDTTFVNGYPARAFLDAMVVTSNNLPWSATLTVATQPTDGDTVTVFGTTFTFKTTLTPTPGEVLIGGSAANARTNLKHAIEGTGTPGTDYVAVSTTQQMYLQRNRRIAVTIVSNDMNFTGFGDISVSETLTAAADVWSKQVKNIFFTTVGATDLALQLDSGLEMSRPKPASGEIKVTRLSGLVMHNAKTFTDGLYSTVKTFVDASNY
jgi:hypothetical protein